MQALPPAPDGVAVLNYDDPWVRQMAEMTRARVFFYGLDPRAELWADSVEGLGLEGIRFRLHHRNEVLYLRVPMIGRHSVHTALRAAAVGLADGLTWQEIVDGLRSQHTQLRLVAVRTASGALILDDTYNASPESVLAALNLLAEIGPTPIEPTPSLLASSASLGRQAAGMENPAPSAGAARADAPRKIAVLGDMLELGPYEKQGHHMVGVRAAEVVDQLITIGERGHMIAESARQAGLASDCISEFVDRGVDPTAEPDADEPGAGLSTAGFTPATAQAIDFLAGRLRAGDVVLVKGSHGMRMDRIVAALEVEQ